MTLHAVSRLVTDHAGHWRLPSPWCHHWARPPWVTLKAPDDTARSGTTFVAQVASDLFVLHVALEATIHVVGASPRRCRAVRRRRMAVRTRDALVTRLVGDPDPVGHRRSSRHQCWQARQRESGTTAASRWAPPVLGTNVKRLLQPKRNPTESPRERVARPAVDARAPRPRWPRGSRLGCDMSASRRGRGAKHADSEDGGGVPTGMSQRILPAKTRSVRGLHRKRGLGTGAGEQVLKGTFIVYHSRLRHPRCQRTMPRAGPLLGPQPRLETREPTRIGAGSFHGDLDDLVDRNVCY